MVKFEKQLEGQLVPEWKEEYVNYKQLKKDLNQIKEAHLKQKHSREHQCHIPSHDISIPQEQICNSFGSPLKNIEQLKHHRWSLWSQGRIHMVIHHRRSEASDAGEDFFQTELLGAPTHTEAQKVFFGRLDSQVSMVNKFYKFKEQEYITWASQLQQQMDILVETRKRLSCQLLMELSPRNHDEGKMLRTAFTELYRGLSLLKSYSSLNMAAFRKIMKKYDKITGQSTSDIYLRAVECSYFSSSNKLIKEMKKVELLYAQYFTKNNHCEALAYLKPLQQTDNHEKIFLLGLFSGSSMSLLVMIVLLIVMQRDWSFPVGSGYEQSVFPTFSTLALFLLHLYVYSCNLYIWQRLQINYTGVFELAPGTELSFHDVLLLSTGLTTILLGGIVIQLILYGSVIKTSVHQPGDVLPISLILIFCIFLFLPFNVCYKSSRFRFLRCIGYIICSPLYKVTLSDFFLADQLTSQVTAFRNIAWISCYHICRQFNKNGSAACTETTMFHNFEYFISVLPYWWRLMQCLRRWLDEGDRSHIANGGKYLSALLAIVVRLTFENNNSRKWLTIFIITSAFATSYQLYWDIVVDWGFLQPKSINPWLRDNLILRQRCVYFVSMGINTIFRLAWLFSVLNVHGDKIDRDMIEFVFGSMEVSRRGLWNFFRLESEHLNNMGKYKGVERFPFPSKNIEANEFYP